MLRLSLATIFSAFILTLLVTVILVKPLPVSAATKCTIDPSNLTQSWPNNVLSLKFVGVASSQYQLAIPSSSFGTTTTNTITTDGQGNGNFAGIKMPGSDQVGGYYEYWIGQNINSGLISSLNGNQAICHGTIQIRSEAPKGYIRVGPITVNPSTNGLIFNLQIVSGGITQNFDSQTNNNDTLKACGSNSQCIDVQYIKYTASSGPQTVKIFNPVISLNKQYEPGVVALSHGDGFVINKADNSISGNFNSQDNASDISFDYAPTIDIPQISISPDTITSGGKATITVTLPNQTGRTTYSIHGQRQGTSGIQELSPIMVLCENNSCKLQPPLPSQYSNLQIGAKSLTVDVTAKSLTNLDQVTNTANFNFWVTTSLINTSVSQSLVTLAITPTSTTPNTINVSLNPSTIADPSADNTVVATITDATSGSYNFNVTDNRPGHPISNFSIPATSLPCQTGNPKTSLCFSLNIPANVLGIGKQEVRVTGPSSRSATIYLTVQTPPQQTGTATGTGNSGSTNTACQTNCTSSSGAGCNTATGHQVNVEVNGTTTTYTDKGNNRVVDPKNIGVFTAIGCVPSNPIGFVKGLITFILAMSGGIALLLMGFSAIGMVTSAGNPEALKSAQGRFSSAIIGLLFIIFAVLLLQIIGADILNIPGFSH